MGGVGTAVGFDWDFVAELVIGLALGIGIGGYATMHFLEVTAMRVLTNPSVRKIANAADKFSGAAAGGTTWPGLIGSALNFFTGGRFMPGGGAVPGPGTKVVVNENGEVVGQMGANGEFFPAR